MGYNLEPPVARGKAKWLLENVEGAEEQLIARFPDDKNVVLVCVMENGSFDAAALCYSKRELNQLLPHFDDMRPRRWITMPRTAALELCTFTPERLDKILREMQEEQDA